MDAQLNKIGYLRAFLCTYQKLQQERKRFDHINKRTEDDWYYGKGWIFSKKPEKLELTPYRYS